jgi:tripartite-type tricarboxylate transporter receptor subunit TctC
VNLLSAASLTAAILLAPSAPASAQTYPNRVVKMIVPAGPAGPTDLLGRLVAGALSNSLGQSFIIENRGGAGGGLGAKAAAVAPADGYTLLVGNTATLANIPAVSKTLDYDPTQDFMAVAKIMDSFQVLVVNPELPVKSVAELVAYAKAHPGKLNHAAVGAGNLTHLSGELLKLRTGIDFVSIQYKSGGEAMTALLGGQADFGIDNIAVTHPLISSGKLRALAVTSRTRQPSLPGVPTMIEAGVPDYVVTSFFGVVAPAATPAPIIDKLNAEIRAALKTPVIQAALEKLDAKPADETPQQFQFFIAGEFKKWKEIADIGGIKID